MTSNPLKTRTESLPETKDIKSTSESGQCPTLQDFRFSWQWRFKSRCALLCHVVLWYETIISEVYAASTFRVKMEAAWIS